MRILLVAVLSAWLCLPIWITPAEAQSASAPQSDQDAIHAIIAAQIEAFRRDDALAAFGYAAPSTQGIFGTPENFLDMVRRGYAPVYRPRSVEFGPMGDEDGAIVQRVDIVGPDGLSYTARYTMEHEADGSWRIVACEILQARRLGV